MKAPLNLKAWFHYLVGLMNQFSLTIFKTSFILICLLISSFSWAQRDTLVFKNGDLMVGEIKNFSVGVLVMKTDYSDKDFQIEFHEVEEMIIERKCLILLTKGRRRFGNIRTVDKGRVKISYEDDTAEIIPISHVIGLQEVEDNFWRRFKGRFDVGFNLTKANNNLQITGEARLDYNGQKYISTATANFLSSSRDDVDETRRIDAYYEILRILKKNWFVLGSYSFLRNTEQALDGRHSPSLGVGRMAVSTNKLYLAISAGATLNLEDFVDNSQNKTSGELFLGANFNMFDFSDIDLISGVRFYPSLTQSGRIRTDYDLTLKYDLPLDLYVKLGFNFNYDNQPAVNGTDFDYIVSSGIGWKFND